MVPSTTKHFALGRIQILLCENVSGCIFKRPSVSHITVGQTWKKLWRKNVAYTCRIVFRRHKFAYYSVLSTSYTVLQIWMSILDKQGPNFGFCTLKISKNWVFSQMMKLGLQTLCKVGNTDVPLLNWG